MFIYIFFQAIGHTNEVINISGPFMRPAEFRSYADYKGMCVCMWYIQTDREIDKQAGKQYKISNKALK